MINLSDSIHFLINQKHDVRRLDCFHPPVKPTLLGPIDKASSYLHIGYIRRLSPTSGDRD
jgi:hypothetical protein